MTSHPIQENAGHWWLTTGKWRRLHAITAAVLTDQQMSDSIDNAEPLLRRAACGEQSHWVMPGIGSRMSLRRCDGCCTALGLPAGNGTPANEASLRSATLETLETE